MFHNLTCVADATLNMTTKPINTHLSNRCKQVFEKSKAHLSMDDLSTLLTPTQPSVGSPERVRLVSSPPVQR